MKEYPFRRYAAGAGAVRQSNTVAPAKKGWWAFPAGCEKGADNVPPGIARRWVTLMVPADALIYTSWGKDGLITRDGFFNSGDWNLMSVEDAMLSLQRLKSRCLAISTTDNARHGMPWQRIADPANLQCFIPASARVR